MLMDLIRNSNYELAKNETIDRMILLDDNYEPYFRSDQANVHYPVRFATVTFRLLDPLGLCAAADKFVTMEGGRPLWFGDNAVLDDSAWYEFYIGINGYTNSNVDGCIQFYIENSDQVIAPTMMSIPLSEEEQYEVRKALDKECQRVYGKSVDDFLEEAKELLKEDM